MASKPIWTAGRTRWMNRCELHRPSLHLLKRYGSSTQQTYAYNLVDHLTWMVIHRKTPRSIALDDLVTGVPQET